VLCLGAATAIRLALDSAGPPGGPLAPRLVPRDDAVAYAESRPRTGPPGASWLFAHVLTDIYLALA
jgi:hypothetical protein